MGQSLKEEILVLRKLGKPYDYIKDKLNCSKATISYHCQNNGLSEIGLSRLKLTEGEIELVKEYYKSHTILETSKEFNISESTVKRYANKKRIILTEKEKKERNYKRVKDRRQKLKELAVEYKGGKCERCPYNTCIWAFEFHHLNPDEKDFIISSYSTLSWNKIKIELDKCMMVCANCHREIHYEEYTNGL